MCARNRRSLLLLVAFGYSASFWAASLNAQATELNGAEARGDQLLRFNHLTVNDGLSQSLARAILQDRQGFMWFATGGGLNRFDGLSFKVYNTVPFDSNSLSSSDLLSLFEDENGVLWIGAAEGINRFDQTSETFTRYLHDPDDPGFFRRSISEDQYCVS